MQDFHNHCCFSYDSNTPMEENIKSAINKNLKYIAITDHCDIYSSNDNFRDNYNPDKYFETIDKLIIKYKSDIKIFKAVEMGIHPHLSYLTDKIISDYPYDFVLGSIHAINGKDIVIDDLYTKYSLEEMYEKYYNEMKEAVKATKNFDVLSHIDYPDRYVKNSNLIPSIDYYIDDIKEIFKILINRNQGIELNTASIRKGLNYIHPKDKILKLYKSMGGEIITVGSDAHNKGDIGFFSEEAINHLKDIGFKKISIFEKRKNKFINIK